MNVCAGWSDTMLRQDVRDRRVLMHTLLVESAVPGVQVHFHSLTSDNLILVVHTNS